MKYHSQKVAYYFFCVCMALVSLQIVYGVIMAAAHVGYDVLHSVIPFNAARATHTNVLLVWLICGFMGAAYYIIPEEVDHELVSVKLAYIQLISLVLVSVTAVIGFHLNWWEGRKFLEIPRFLDYLVVINVLLFLGLLAATILKGRRYTTTSLILFFSLMALALLYLPGMVDTTNQTVDSILRWWVVHLWVEGVWELVLGSILAYLLIKLTGVDREVIEKWLYVIISLTFLSGIVGTGHHYYYIGTPKYWLLVGGFFSALEPLAFLTITIYAFSIVNNKKQDHPNKIAVNWVLSCSILAFCGAGFLGFIHTLPPINLYTHGTLITAMHGHLAFWGAYASLVLAVIAYTLPIMTGCPIYNNRLFTYAFWAANIGMILIVLSFACAGITQVFLERKLGLDFFIVRNELVLFFYGLIFSAFVFASGIFSYVYVFVKAGLPNAPILGEDRSVS